MTPCLPYGRGKEATPRSSNGKLIFQRNVNIMDRKETPAKDFLCSSSFPISPLPPLFEGCGRRGGEENRRPQDHLHCYLPKEGGEGENRGRPVISNRRWGWIGPQKRELAVNLPLVKDGQERHTFKFYSFPPSPAICMLRVSLAGKECWVAVVEPFLSPVAKSANTTLPPSFFFSCSI